MVMGSGKLTSSKSEQETKKRKKEKERIHATIIILLLYYEIGTIGHKNDKLTRAARTMSLFVLVFIVQWGAAAVFGAWTMVDDRVPLEIVFPVMTFSSLGGLLNGIVYLNMRKTKKWKISKTVISVITRQTTT